MTFYIQGNLGADGGGNHIVGEFESGKLKGFYTMTCNGNGNDASVNHLFVFDRTLSPNARHTYNPNTDSDDDTVSGIGPGSPFVYVLYASRRGASHCHSREEHEAMFQAVVDVLQCSGGGENINDGGDGGDGRIKIDAPSLALLSTASITPDPGSMPELEPYIGDDLTITSGETVSFNTDGYTVFHFTNLNITGGGMLTGVGSRPLLIEVSGECLIGGTIQVSGGNGESGHDARASGGGGAGGGAVKLTCNGTMVVFESGRVLANGGDGACACGTDDSDIGTGGVAICGGYDGGAGTVYDVSGPVNGGNGFGPGAGLGGLWVADRQPPGGGGGGYGVAGHDAHCDAIAGDALLSCYESGGTPYGDDELEELLGGSGGGAGSDGPQDLEGVGGAGAGALQSANHIPAPLRVRWLLSLTGPSLPLQVARYGLLPRR